MLQELQMLEQAELKLWQKLILLVFLLSIDFLH